ncbi:pentatricopeptide repeat-containing protein at3g04130 mitochondrial [Phtheirospermum japonicum]|uniref:Pentatricopeptide repeat-containing protein at3g04130 mitochondrial n=1 Tax=Phtheirospermum japonicum TaxID=374723 RepID=A0A830C8G5_9LAMI|nr:pentatricopeptide repeat-containing protein at3g04130 mitochondrial [Phtheirospermum japonicum]
MVLHHRLLSRVVCRVVSKHNCRHFSTSQHCPTVESYHKSEKCIDFKTKHDADIIISRVTSAKNETEAVQSLLNDIRCNTINITHTLVSRLLHRFQDDWKSALGVFRWAETHPHYKLQPESYDKLVDILGKTKQMDKMKALVDEMREHNFVSLNTISKMMRRFTGAGDWKDAVKTFDELENYGLEKNTESMNVLLDTLCKEKKVEQARSIFLELRPHISPNASTYTIFINGWCKIKRVEEAQWTFEEMRGNGFRPCVVSYSIIIQFYCSESKFYKVYEVLDEMQADGCCPNVVTFTTIMHSLTKSGDLNEALKIAERVRLVGCKPDTQFYNALIHTLGRSGRVEEALNVFTKEMPGNEINPNTSTYNTMIAMFCHHRQEKRAVQFLRDLEKSPCCKPDGQSFYPLMKLYLRDGKTDKCLSSLLDDMVKKHHLCLNLASFTLLIHGLCRAKKCEWAYELFREMLGQNIKPKYLTCSLLLKEIKLNNMHDEAEMIEDYMKKMKSL